MGFERGVVIFQDAEELDEVFVVVVEEVDWAEDVAVQGAGENGEDGGDAHALGCWRVRLRQGNLELGGVFKVGRVAKVGPAGGIGEDGLGEGWAEGRFDECDDGCPDFVQYVDATHVVSQSVFEARVEKGGGGKTEVRERAVEDWEKGVDRKENR